MGEWIDLVIFCGWVATGGSLLAWILSPSIDTNFAEASRRLEAGIRYVLWWFIVGVLATAGFFTLELLIDR